LKDKIKFNTHKDGLPKGFIDVLLKRITTTNADVSIVELLVLENHSRVEWHVQNAKGSRS
jgi:hypothetical protein